MEELQEPIQEEQVDNTEEEVESIDSETTEQPERTEDKNFIALRETKEKAEQERDYALRRLRELEEQQRAYDDYGAYNYDNYAPQDDYNLSIKDDDLVEGKHLSKVAQKIRNLEAQIQNYEQKTSYVTAESRLKSQYPDFDKVVSRANIDALQAHYPELAHTLNSGQDLYSTGVSAYTMIKKMGIYKEDPYVKDKELAQKNSGKPKSLASVSPQQGNSPMSRANAFAEGLTDELKEQLRKEMEEAIKYR